MEVHRYLEGKVETHSRFTRHQVRSASVELLGTPVSPCQNKRLPTVSIARVESYVEGIICRATIETP